jgi:23S rRNA (uracil1939-C5)-methyltransferase
MAEAIQARLLPTRSQRWELLVGAGSDRVFAVDEAGKAWELEPDGWHVTQEPVVQNLEAFKLRHRPGGFFQVCTPWAVKTFGETLGKWDLRGGTLFDLFGGVGLFSALLGDRFRQRVLVEGDEGAVSWARKNLEALDLPSECHAADVTAWVPEGLGTPEDLILLDPPRAGLDEALSAKLLSAGTTRMILVGCDGAAFCRDIKRLGSTWKIQDLVAMDLFPLTVHAEFIALLERV